MSSSSLVVVSTTTLTVLNVPFTTCAFCNKLITAESFASATVSESSAFVVAFTESASMSKTIISSTLSCNAVVKLPSSIDSSK